eukprot:7762231-Karenia_brevis.AAC.1
MAADKQRKKIEDLQCQVHSLESRLALYTHATSTLDATAEELVPQTEPGLSRRHKWFATADLASPALLDGNAAM